MEFETAEDLTAHILKMAKDQKSAEASAQNVDRGSERSSRRL
jgi:antitoxin ParD1/3/4